MKTKRLGRVGAAFTIFLGTLLHFTYEWSGANKLVGLFSAVNESTWEHLKLLCVPMLLFAFLEALVYGKQCTNFIPARLVSILAGMAVIVVTFYTYTGIFGTHFFLADIAIFLLGVIVSYRVGDFFLCHTTLFTSKRAAFLGWFGYGVLWFLFFLFTFCPPHIPLFQDPVTMRYGV